MAANLLSLKRQLAADAEMLVQAAESGDKTGVEALLAAGVDANAPLKNGQTPLMAASSKGHADIIKTLLAAGADVNARRDDGFTPLCAATFFGNTDVVRLLVDEGADVKVKTLLGSTAKSWASSRGYHEIVELLEATEKTYRAAIIKAISPAENLASAESKTDLSRKPAPSKNLSAAKLTVVAAPIEPQETRPPESVDEEFHRSAPVEALSEPGKAFGKRISANGMDTENPAVDNLSEVTIATAKPAAPPALVALPTEIFVEKKETKVSAHEAEQQPLFERSAATPTGAVDVTPLAALSGKDHKSENDQTKIYPTELEPGAQTFIPVQPERNVHTWIIAAAMIVVMFTSGLITYLLQQHQSQSTREQPTQATINHESLTNNPNIQPAEFSSAAVAPASLKPKEASATTRNAARRQQQAAEPSGESSQNLSNNKRAAAAPQSQSKKIASTFSPAASVKLERNATRSKTREVSPRTTARAEQPRETDSRPLHSIKREAKRQTIKASTDVSSPDSVSSVKTPASDAPSKPSSAPKKKVINWP